MGQALRRASGRLRTSAADKSPAPPIKTTVDPTPPAVPFNKVSGDSAVNNSCKYIHICNMYVCVKFVRVCWEV